MPRILIKILVIALVLESLREFALAAIDTNLVINVNEGPVESWLNWGLVLGVLLLVALGVGLVSKIRNADVGRTEDVAAKPSPFKPAPYGEDAELNAMAALVDHQTRAAVSKMASLSTMIGEASSPESNRRVEPRYQLKRMGSVTVDGVVYPVVIENISVSGIKGVGLPQAVPAGKHLDIVIDGTSIVLSTVALAVDAGKLNGKFQLTPDNQRRWAADFAQLARELTPIMAGTA